MQYPCKTCIVDPICETECELLLFYIKFLDNKGKPNIPMHLISTKNRAQRTINCSSLGVVSSNFYREVVETINYHQKKGLYN